jgi:hypothetical protein
MPIPGGGFQFDMTKSPQSLRFDLSPDEVGEPLGVAIKYDGDDEAYAFSWQSYAPYGKGFRNPIYLLPDTAYDVNVEAKAGEIAASARFLLTNDGDRRTGLSLSPAPRQLPR